MSRLHLQVLRSSSAGNCTAVWNDEGKLLIDAGVSKSTLAEHLDGDDAPLNGVVVTHGHGDHLSNSAAGYLLRRSVPIHLPDSQVEAYYRKRLTSLSNASCTCYEGRPFLMGEFQIAPFPLKHDADGGCFGLSITLGEKKIAFATDLVEAGEEPLRHFSDADLMVIEANYDPELLEQSDRPEYLKNRVRIGGHLSNQKCADFLVRVLKKSAKPPTAIFLAHMSRQCNSGDIALKTVNGALAGAGFSGVPVLLSFYDRPSEKAVV